MSEKQIVTSIIVGCAMIAIGLIPGTFAALKEGIERFEREIRGEFPTTSQPSEAKRLPGQVWFAVAGFALVTLGLAVLIAR